MSIELILLVLLPMAVAAVAAGTSVYCALRSPSLFQAVSTLAVVSGAVWAELVLYQVVQGAWPTLTPHLLIVLLLAVVGVQLWRASSAGK